MSMKNIVYLIMLCFCLHLYADETFINHTNEALRIQCDYTFCKSDATVVAPTTIQHVQNMPIIKVGQATIKSSSSCCLKYMRIMRGGTYKTGRSGLSKFHYIDGGNEIYKKRFEGCKGRTFNIYPDTSKSNGIRVES